jgi:hypothetical protein
VTETFGDGELARAAQVRVRSCGRPVGALKPISGTTLEATDVVEGRNEVEFASLSSSDQYLSVLPSTSVPTLTRDRAGMHAGCGTRRKGGAR